MFHKLYRSNLSTGKKALLALVTVRHAGTPSSEGKPQLISKHISYRPALKSPLELDKRPIVLLYGWIAAKAKHIYKYGDFYMDKGFDVVHIKIKPSQLLWPKSAQVVVDNVLDFVSEGERAQQPILSHGFSVGVYLHGEALVKINDSAQYGQVGERLRGQILDSPVDFASVPEGFSKAMTDNFVLQKVMRGSLEGYVRIFSSAVKQHYMGSQQAVLDNKFNIPSLYLYSKSDKISDAKAIEKVMDGLQRNGQEVQSQLFENSKHVSHLHMYPVEYIGALNRFLDHCGLLQDISLDRLRNVNLL